jgi:hypothetical protein
VRLVATIAVFVGVVVFGCYTYAVWGYSWKANVSRQVALSKTEEHAAYGSKRFPEGSTDIELEAGERVAVLWDTYGKDYWVCYVRDSAGRIGWILCKSIEKSDS